MTKWTQESIHRWAIDTFGGVSLNPLLVAIRMAKEAQELSIYLMIEENPQEVAKESADVAIMLVQVARLLDMDAVSVFEHPDYEDIYATVWDECDTDTYAGVLLGEHMIDLISCIVGGQRDQARNTIAGIVAILDSIEEIYEFDLGSEIHDKMEINVARTWNQGKDGSFQHVD